MMNTKIKALTYCITLILGFIIAVFPVQALPQMPHQFYGAVTVAGDPAPDGTLVEAVISNITYANTTTVDGKYGYDPLFKVLADDPDTPEKEGGESGDTIDFYVAKTYAANYTFEIGHSIELNLTAAAPTPYAEFIADVTNGAEPLTAQFIDQSMYFDNITLWAWDFGDENTTATTVANITHTYIQNGTYTVSLTVNGTKNGNNVTDTETKVDYIVVYDTKPTADFYATPTSGLEPLTVSFYDNSTSYDNITLWAWDFGDENTSSEQNPTHNYTTAGIYTVNLTVTEPDGDNHTLIKENYITVETVPPTISVTSPTTENPVYTKAGQTITINFTYTTDNPKNVTLRVYNTTTTIGETTITDLQAGTNIERNASVTLDTSASDGKYHIEATIYTLEGLNGTDTETEAVIVDTTAPSISNPYQDPPGQVVEPGELVEVDFGQNITVQVNVTDLTSGVKTVTLSYNVSATQWENITMNKIAGNEYTATIPSSELPPCTTINYYITAYDNAGNHEKIPLTEIYYNYHVIPEFTSALAILLILLAFTATIAVKRKQKRLR